MIDKVIVIGWDGATWAYLDQMLAGGKLPNLADLLARGARATLRSTVPPFTNIAWPSLVTGLAPAKTGIFDGARSKDGSYEAIPTNLTGHRGIPIWHWLNGHGRSTAVINVPMTFPARPVDGCLVTGFDSPRRSPQVAYPPDLLPRWAAQGHPYTVLADEIALMDSQNPHQPRGDVTDFVARWRRVMRQQGEHITWLWRQEAVDFIFTVFSGTDSVNHRTNDFALITRVYEAADEALGRILEVVNDRTLVCLVSDHGSTPARRYLSLYRALHDGGWLHFRRQVARRYLSRLPARWHHLGQRLPEWLKAAVSRRLLSWDGRLAEAYDNIDWTKTRVYARSGMGALYINRREVRPQGIVPDEAYETLRAGVREHLLSLRDSAGQPLLRCVHLGEALYPGAEAADEPPDLVVEPFTWSDHLITGFTSDPLLRSIPREREYGTHTPDGILLLAGPGVKPGTSLDVADIVDVVPTLLAAWQVPLPAEVDGRVLQEAFVEPLTFRHIDSSMVKVPAAARTDADMEDSAEVLARLRGLGYME